MGQILLAGLEADLPTPRARRNPRMFFATDTAKLYIEVADEWVEAGGEGGGGGGGPEPSDFNIEYSPEVDELQIQRVSGDFDLETIDAVGFEIPPFSGELNSGQIQTSPTFIQINGASAAMAEGTLTELRLKSGGDTIVTIDGLAVEMIPA